MALVAYDNSDSSEYEDECDENFSKVVGSNLNENKTDVKPIESHEEIKQDEIEAQSLFNLLPQPSNVKQPLIEEDDEFLHKKVNVKTEQKPKSKITVPSLSDFKDVEDTVPSMKPKIAGGKKSGLLSILPQPKNGVKTTTKALIPNVLTQKPPNTVKKKMSLPSSAIKQNVEIKTNSLVTEYSDESDTDDVQNDFFSINKQVEVPIEDLPLDIEQDSIVKTNSVTNKKEPRSLESYFKKDDDTDMLVDNDLEKHSNDSTIPDQTNDVPESSNNEVVLDEEAIMKLVGARGKRRREEIQIVDVNQQEVLNDAREWLLKGLMDDTSKRQSSSKKRGNEPTSQQRRKHQITYLAHQAKANEAELENQWANSRMNKRKTQSKYGF